MIKKNNIKYKNKIKHQIIKDERENRFNTDFGFTKSNKY